MIPLFEETNGLVSDQVRYISFFFNQLAILYKLWLVILSLVRQDAVIIKAHRVGAQVPFTDHCGLVARLF
ncbi:hypothetical protein D3C86_1680050 [compost metagenome]